ncbi:hypothetical protein CD798_00750 [Bacillaceae bacterium SAOS 7]|nr:hypothetical protein CEW92_09965 [Bacillaceae bacterium SAS-127]PAQ16646.1 hypothetical protein CD798_00750 [Bacillaceae bacterium SAOS 7]
METLAKVLLVVGGGFFAIGIIYLFFLA